MARKIATGDCETDPFLKGRIPEPFLWGYFDGEVYRQFHDTAEYVKFISQQNVILYMHNGGKFDFHMLIDHIPHQELRIIHNRMVSIRIGKCEMRDSYAILPVKLADYQKDNIEYWKLEKEHRAKHMREIERYCEMDCVYLYEMVKAFAEMAGTKLTLASNALAFSKALGIDIGNTDKNFDSQFRGDYYYGGRCQALQIGEHHNVNMYDIRSAYPYAMLHEHPTGDSFRHCTKLLSRERSDLCFYKIKATSRGAFPRRARDASLYFPKETGEFTVTGRELYAALETGACDLHKVIECREFYKSINFALYVDHWFNERQKYGKGTPENLVCKTLLNSLYGKAAQNPEHFKDYMLQAPKKPIPKGWHLAAETVKYDLLYRNHIDHLKEKVKNYETIPQFFNIATASSITGFVRAMLLRAIASQNGGAIYCDTDSLFTRGTLPTGNSLGQWQFEGRADILYVAGKKLYAARMEDGSEKIACKGVKINFEQIKKVTEGAEVTWESEAPNFSLAKPPSFVVRRVKKRA